MLVRIKFLQPGLERDSPPSQCLPFGFLQELFKVFTCLVCVSKLPLPPSSFHIVFSVGHTDVESQTFGFLF